MAAMASEITIAIPPIDASFVPNVTAASRTSRTATPENNTTPSPQKQSPKIIRKPLVPLPKSSTTSNISQSSGLEQDSTGIPKSTSANAVSGLAMGRTGLESRSTGSFTVASVGRGKIFLRPSIRPQAIPAPIAPAFTNKIKVSQSLSSIAKSEDSRETRIHIQNNRPATPESGTRFAEASTRPPSLALSQSTVASRAHRRKRSQSDGAFRKSHLGVVRINIEQTPSERPRSVAETELDHNLDIAIPHYRIGKPAFADNGDAVMDAPSSLSSVNKFPTIPARIASQRVASFTPERRQTVEFVPSPLVEDVTSSSNTLPIDPRIFESLSFPPGSDSKSVVKYAANGELAAATPARLVAEITSIHFLDYDLIGDFFLTYRAYLKTGQLFDLLIARLHWALNRRDEMGSIVRVRTFVALRHWVLNYFIDDFLPDYDLRVRFCDTLNALYEKLVAEHNTMDIKICGELKRCWRSTCVLYWDNIPGIEAGFEVPIHPGGPAGSRQSSTRPVETSAPSIMSAARLSEIVLPRIESISGADSLLVEEPMRHKPVHDSGVADMSISIPSARSNSSMLARTTQYMAAVLNNNSNEVNELLKARPMLLRPQPSFTGSLRDAMPPSSVSLAPSQTHLALPYTGSLVRGAAVPPTESLAENVAPVASRPMSAKMQYLTGETSLETPVSAVAKPTGVKRLFGSVRKAFGGRPLRERSVKTTNSVAVNFRSMKSVDMLNPDVYGFDQPAATASLTRIDLLGAGAAESFKKALQEEQPEVEVEKEEEEGEDISIENLPALPPPKLVNVRMPTGAPKQLPRHYQPRPISVVSAVESDTTIELAPTEIETRVPTKKPEVKHFVPQKPPTRIASPSRVEKKHRLRSSRSEGFLRGLACIAFPSNLPRSIMARKPSVLLRSLTHRQQPHELDAESRRESIQSYRSSISAELPARTLRRRPGGNLKGAKNVGDLARRFSRMTIGSRLESYCASRRFTIEPQRFSLGALRERTAGDKTSFLETHSSIPNLRPSFEKEIEKLARLPDDDSDGGIEATLLKLEGKYEARSRGESLDIEADNEEVDPDEKARHRHNHVIDATLAEDEIPQFKVAVQEVESRASLAPSPIGLDMSLAKLVIPRAEDSPKSPGGHSMQESFLLDDDESIASRRASLDKTFPPVSSSTVIAELQTAVPQPPPSPPLTMDSPHSATPSLRAFDQPLTPHMTPTQLSTTELPLGYNPRRKPSRAASIHLPFILAHDSSLLAEQFTIIERDALAEIDWKQLVELRFVNSPALAPDVHDWVEYLKTHSPHGVELVVARFNLMARWTASQIVLTEDVKERAQTITKFIHIAAHSRKMRNFTTLYQLVSALASPDITRLKRTWAIVSTTDVELLKDLEKLVLPINNFASLRAEMESPAEIEPRFCSTEGAEPCIPFVGLYTNDLIRNNLQLSEIYPTTTVTLINFEKFRQAATIVKNLLRLLNASQEYNLQVEKGVIERCLWISALSKLEIERRSKEVESE